MQKLQPYLCDADMPHDSIVGYVIKVDENTDIVSRLWIDYGGEKNKCGLKTEQLQEKRESHIRRSKIAVKPYG